MRYGVGILLFAFAVSSHAATITTFIAVGADENVTVTNSHAGTVIGRARLIPRAGSTAPDPHSLLSPYWKTETFVPASTFRAADLPAIIAIESSDVLDHTGGRLLPLAHPNRPAVIHFATSANGQLLVGLLGGEVRVKIYSSRSSTPAATVDLPAGSERVESINVAALVPETAALGGWVSVEPVASQAVAYGDFAPLSRRRGVRAGSSNPPLLSVSLPQSCVDTPTYAVSASGVADASFTWAAYGAASTANLSASSIAVTAPPSGYVTVAATSSDPTRAPAEVNLSAPQSISITSFHVTNTSGSDLQITWDPVPGFGVITGTDFPNGIAVDLMSGEFFYMASAGGAKTLTLTPDGGCASQAATETYSVAGGCAQPKFDIAPFSFIVGPRAVGYPMTINWGFVPGTEPTKLVLTDTELGRDIELAPSLRTYTYVVHMTGNHNFSLLASNECTTLTAGWTASFNIQPACGHSFSGLTANPWPAHTGATLTASMMDDANASYTWEVAEGGTIESGLGTHAIVVHVTAPAGGYVRIRGTMTYDAACSDSDEMAVPVAQ